MPDQYTVVLRGETFTLYLDQLQFDSPNYFTKMFLGEFQESSTHKAVLSRNPLLFRVVVEYMSGYTVLPLAPAMIPPTMTATTALENLLIDAEYYQLDGLVNLICAKPGKLLRAAPEAYRAFGISPSAVLQFEHIGVAKDVFYKDGIVDKDGQRVLIEMLGVKLMFNGAFFPLFTKEQQEKLQTHGVLASSHLWRDTIPIDGTSYETPQYIEYWPEAVMKMNGCEFRSQTLVRMCATTKEPNSFIAIKEKELKTSAERKVFQELKATYDAGKTATPGQASRLILWCRKLVFIIGTGTDSKLPTLHIVHADCITRSGLTSQLLV